MAEKITIAGVMTGTSCDGVDIAAIEFDPEGWAPKWEVSLPYPSALRKKVFHAQESRVRMGLVDWAALDCEIGEWLGESLVDVIEAFSGDDRPEVLAVHGQTVGHFPRLKPHGFTVQLGDPSRVAAKTGRTVVSHFRHGDVAMGGEGAPLVPAYHYLLSSVLPNGSAGIAIHNLGGISNFTYISPRGSILACDTGPANVWIDAAAEKISRGKKKFDTSGKMAAAGKVNERVLLQLLKHPFLKKPAPKSTGRGEFDPKWFFQRAKSLKGNDLVATATAFTVESIAQAYERFVLELNLPLKSIYLCGGGAKNQKICEWLGRRLAPIEVGSIENFGFESQYVEAQAFAFLAYRSLLGLPLGGSWTGVKEFAPPGKITPGRNWTEVLKSLP